MGTPAGTEHLLLHLWHSYRLLVLVAVALAYVVLYIRLRSRQKQSLARNNSPIFPAHVKDESVRELDSSNDKLKTSLFGQTSVPRKIRGKRPVLKPKERSEHPEAIQPTIFFYSLGGATSSRAKALGQCLTQWQHSLDQSGTPFKLRQPLLLDLSEIDYDDYFTALPKNSESLSHFYLILMPTYNIDTNLTNFLTHLQETHHDFRVDTAPLRNILGYSVFGFGDKDEWPTEAAGFCMQASTVDKWMARLSGGKRAYPIGMGDAKSNAQERLDEWRLGIESVLFDIAAGKGLGEGFQGSGDAVESDEEDDLDDEVATEAAVQRPAQLSEKTRKSAMLDDVENLGLSVNTNGAPTVKRSKKTTVPIDFTTYTTSPPPLPPPSAQEMVPVASPTHKALTKQGYSVIGSHSGIKLCRWTKSALRGRGSCYKKSFYGIASHNCMECTPALSCSNKCVFCWRHGTNPVGTTWRWKVDDPAAIFAGVTAAHYQKIKVMRGVPGVRADRFEDAMRIKHCALSLVGEPIFYPHINEFVGLLHNDRISSFLVCNAQHPAQLAALTRVTQLYVSIDAADRDTLRRIDRPLHRDFWERFCACLDILREVRFRQRTVFRLTLVKGFNIDEEVDGYAALVERALPCFVEVKGVTFCGTSTSAGAGLTMQNVPFYEEVVAFVEALNKALGKRGLEYGIAAEHAHSCCALLASRRFWRPVDETLVEPLAGEGTVDEATLGQQRMAWHTTIDYARFFSLLESGQDFTPEDYCAPTVEWALWGRGGFDPSDQRVGKKGKGVGSVKPAIEMARVMEG